MNKIRLEKIAKWLENGAIHTNIVFDMSIGYLLTEKKLDPLDPPICRTTCCIAGAAVHFFGDTTDELRPYKFSRGQNFMDWFDVLTQATDLLGLDDSVAVELFAPLLHYNDPAWAARVIRKLIDTGTVDWVGSQDG